MFRHALRLTIIFIIVQSLLLHPLAASREEEKPTPVETWKALETTNFFMKRLEETGDFSSVIDELYVEDFIWRYVHDKQMETTDSNLSEAFTFAQGVNCKRNLLTHATTQEWQRLYIATYNFYYQALVICLNKDSNSSLNGQEPEDETLEKLLPANVLLLLNRNPILKEVIESKGNSKAIESVEDMREVSETLEEASRLLLAGQDNRMVKLTEESKIALEKLRQTEFAEPALEITKQESFGYPAGTRMVLALTPIFFGLKLVEVSGKPKILWAELFALD